jgi:hypothetical protein
VIFVITIWQVLASLMSLWSTPLGNIGLFSHHIYIYTHTHTLSYVHMFTVAVIFVEVIYFIETMRLLGEFVAQITLQMQMKRQCFTIVRFPFMIERSHKIVIRYVVIYCYVIYTIGFSAVRSLRSWLQYSLRGRDHGHWCRSTFGPRIHLPVDS